jgi:hypothetical protein
LDVLLKIFAELTYFLFYAFFCLGLRHSVFTYLSKKPWLRSQPLCSKK